MEKGDAQVGAGMLAGFGGNSEVALGELSLIGRFGISDRMDIGGKIYGLPHLVQFFPEKWPVHLLAAAFPSCLK
jgi:hypothetical protein